MAPRAGRLHGLRVKVGLKSENTTPLALLARDEPAESKRISADVMLLSFHGVPRIDRRRLRDGLAVALTIQNRLIILGAHAKPSTRVG